MMLVKQLEENFEKLKLGMVEEGITNIKQLLTQSDMTDDLRYEVADYFYELGFIGEAVELVENLYDKHPHENELLLFLAELYIENGQEDEALSLLVSIQPEEEEYVRACLVKADLYFLQGLHEVAEYKLKEALHHYPDETLLHTALGEVFYQQENYQLALISFLKGDTESYDKLADCYAHLGRFEEALPLYEKALNITEHPDLLFGHAFVASQLEKWETANTSFQKLVEQDPYYTSAYPLLVEAYLRLGEEENALESADAGLTYDQTNPQLFYLKGEILLQQGKGREAKELFKRSLEMDESYMLSLEKLMILAKEEEDWSLSLTYVQQMIEYSLERGDLYVQQGFLYEELEQWTRAAESYRQALICDHEDVEALNRLASLMREEGKIEEALPLWKKSLTIEPSQWEIEHFLEQYEMER